MAISKTSFKKGQSGNPKGRSKIADEVRALAAQYSREAIETIIAIMQMDEDNKTRLLAANALLDRAVGKPSQAITGEDGAAIKIDTSGETVLSLLRKLAGESSTPP